MAEVLGGGGVAIIVPVRGLECHRSHYLLASIAHLQRLCLLACAGSGRGSCELRVVVRVQRLWG